MTGGRPLRFLMATLGSWALVRTAMLLPDADADVIVPIVARADPRPQTILEPERSPVRLLFAGAARSDGPARTMTLLSRVVSRAGTPATASMRSVVAAVLPPTQRRDLAISAAPPTGTVTVPPITAPLPVTPAMVRSGRLSGSGWTVLRGGSNTADFAGGRLGGAQAGLRLIYALGEARRFALAGRVSAPLQGRGREAAVGLDWRPTHLPIHLVAEQRIALDPAARTRPALAVIGGLDPTPVAAGFRLEGYGQAGAVAKAGAFADGALRLARPVATFGPARIDLGAGVWGGAQRGAARLDVGPAASLTLPLAERNMRLTLDWRQRIAGRASPGSGPVLAIGSDF